LNLFVELYQASNKEPMRIRLRLSVLSGRTIKPQSRQVAAHQSADEAG
jgi:hypothetical protein